MDVKQDTSADWMIEEDTPANADQNGAAVPAPWRVLIVDDDVDVHVVTKFSLSNACFQGRRLSFLHAYSGDEALHVLRTTPDIALVLLDVIMETSEAGLKVARQIRDELGNRLVRIVLRTGQPGQALEHSIILDYDINDFWCKSDLTTRKLFTTVISSLRGYAGLVDAEHRVQALQAQLARAVGFTLDAEGRIQEASPKAAALLGAEREQLHGLHLSAGAEEVPAEAPPAKYWMHIQ
ncbi:response regulator [Pseudoduganella namucuonensis]|uniref:DNA-binding response regulator, OmpR family, contains REC and winged-helix (WHTH) domain n=1 Tax=Pseudoduganella namucuonensis TaxID=1035707 RepID=A0A1I7GPB0_9BURK|nr:response regulator [Pseudoduganella namucuonensis]SFU50293.1 DNA-binding response regulator, OmpR family, contains REC and winged-helix (wHTH) domain [Pseudoduganella namucuonensis]